MPFAMTSTWFETSDLLSGNLIQLVCHTMSVEIVKQLTKFPTVTRYSILFSIFNENYCF